ncbi:MAG: ring-cleaving dioxygenase [Spirochaetaceae bacterium]|nr:MAG: ring-cleaving dioxygenase [Spirochaetaceae bacterium]
MNLSNGIHHITAIAGDPQQNLDFYVGVLGMRLVKRSVNQDVPDTYHLFYADGAGNPGTDLTFFPWPALPPVQRGAGQWDEVYLGVPAGTLEYWSKRLLNVGAGTGGSVGKIETRFGERVLPFSDPHGMRLALVEDRSYDGFVFEPWSDGPVPADRQIRSLAGVRLVERSSEPTVTFLTAALGFRAAANEGQWQRYVIGQGVSGQRIDLRVAGDARRGQWGVGAVHHVAWRVADAAAQSAVQQAITAAGGRPTQVIDRFWFRSVYATEPGGALLEVATDGPGFSVDEAPGRLGETLVLPEWLEPQRREIEAALMPLEPARRF